MEGEAQNTESLLIQWDSKLTIILIVKNKPNEITLERTLAGDALFDVSWYLGLPGGSDSK